VHDALESARSIPIIENDFDLAASIYRSVRHRGHTVRSGLDCLIAAMAYRSEATLVHRDVDFTRIAEAVPDLTMIDLTA
jgi:predicted nucleic acid-binding protein